MSVQGFVMSLMHGARGKDAAKALILPYIFGEAVGNQSYPVVESSGSAPLEIENAAAKDMLSFKTNIVPVQDLHGYSNPWPGGGGVNKFGPNTNPIIGEYLRDSGGTGEQADWNISDYIAVKPNTEYTFNPNSTSGGAAKTWFYTAYKGQLSYVSSGPQTFTTPATCAYMRFSYRNTSSDITLVEGSTSPAEWTPYENICPIQGWKTITGWIDGKYGGNIEWNQLVKINATDISASGSGITFTDNRDGTYTLVTDADGATADRTFSIGSDNPPMLLTAEQGHKYWLKGCPSGGSATTYWWQTSGSIIDTGDGMIYNRGANPTNSWYATIRIKSGTVITTPITFRPMYIDLTKMFGVGNEPSSLDELNTLFPADYYPYNAGTTTCVGEVNGDEYRKIPVTFGVLGKNLMNPDVFYTYSNWKKDLVSAPSSPTSSGNKGLALDVKAGVTYSITLGITSDNFPANCYLCSASNSLSKRDHEFTDAAYKDNTYTFTAQADTLYYFRLGSTITESSFNTAVGKISYVQLEVGSPTAYEPYNVTVYSGTYNFVTGELVVDKVSRLLTGSISEAWSLYGNPSNGFYINPSNMSSGVRQAGWCNWLPVDRTGGTNNARVMFGAGNSLIYFANIIGSIDGVTDIATWKAYLAQNPLQVVYPLATPIVYHLDPSDIKLLKGTNYLWADCGNTVSASYPTTVHAEDITLTGVSPLLLANSQAKKMSQCDVGIVATQEGSGDPYPAGGGKNLFNPDTTEHWYYSVVGYTEDDSARSVIIPAVEGDKFVLSFTRGTNSGIMYMCAADSNGDMIEGSRIGSSTSSSVSINSAPNGTAYIYAGFSLFDTSTKPQLEKGTTTATAYAPYANIRPIHGVSTLSTTIADNSAGTGGTTYSTEFGCMGKNLFDATAHTFTTGDYVNYTTGSMGHNGSNTAACGDYLQVPTGTFTISCTENVGGRIAFYKQDKTFISGSSTIAGVEVPTDAVYFRFSLQSDTPTNVQIELGSSASAYQPYVNECFGGTYNELTGGLDQSTNYADLGTLSWTLASSYGADIFRTQVSDKALGAINIMCSSYAVTGEGVSQMSDMTIKGTSNGTNIYVRDSRFSDASSFKAAVNGVQLTYELDASIHRQYAPHAPESLAGHTYVITNGGGNITATYKGVDLS